jgi:hypothetical protein
MTDDSDAADTDASPPTASPPEPAGDEPAQDHDTAVDEQDDPAADVTERAHRRQRTIRREVHSTTTQSTTETHETSTTVEDLPLAPLLYAAPAVDDEPWPVG